MTIDLRLPLGALFFILGAVLIVFGLAGDHAIYQRSLGINVNLWWGVVLAIFGALVLVAGLAARRRTP